MNAPSPQEAWSRAIRAGLAARRGALAADAAAEPADRAAEAGIRPRSASPGAAPDRWRESGPEGLSESRQDPAPRRDAARPAARTAPASAESAARDAAGRHGLGYVDLAASPPDPALLDPRDAPACLRHGLLPWRRVGRVTTYAAVDPAEAVRGIARLAETARARSGVAEAPPPGLACVVVTTREGLEAALARAFAAPLAARAAARTPAAHSVRGIGRLRRMAVLALGLLAALVALGGAEALAAALILLFLLNAGTTLLRIAALVAGRAGPDGAPAAPAGTLGLAAHRPLPTISLLVPLYREGTMVRRIVAAIDALDYPRDRLEVRLLLEEDDTETRRAVAAADLPDWVVAMVVPPGGPRTKPRALNYALDFCCGEVIGILDAEDRPEPDQLRAVAATLAGASPRVACVQCQLTYYNATENWLSRCFQLEYAIWFDVLLRGWQALRLPIPLGGTSVYFRRQALEAVGGWDAHNVTEDADLGMRLARRGYACAVLRSTTGEEANCRAVPWIRQRSRWLKGYLLTWLSHMRAPRRLWRELGPRGFLGLNILFLGAATAYLAMPLFWLAVIGWALTGEGLWQSALPGWALWPALASLAAGQAVMLACAALAMLRRGTPGLLWWVPTLPLYWTLGAVAAWKAVIELAVAPFWWDKTRHGISPDPGGAPGRAAAAR